MQNDINFPESSGECYVNDGSVEIWSRQPVKMNWSTLDELLIHSSLPDHGRGGSQISSEPISSGGFGKVVRLKASRKLTDILLTMHFIPPHNYKFPDRLVTFSRVG